MQRAWSNQRIGPFVARSCITTLQRRFLQTRNALSFANCIGLGSVRASHDDTRCLCTHKPAFTVVVPPFIPSDTPPPVSPPPLSLFFSLSPSTVTFVTNCVNFLAVMIAFFSGLMEKVEITPGQPISDFLFATLFLVLGVPLSFLGWYYQSYKVMQNNRVTKKYYWVFFLMILNIGFCISQACGLYSGAAGAGYMGRYLACGQAQCQTYIPTGPEQSTFQVIGSFYVFSFCFWVVSALIAMFCLLLLYKFYKSSGGEDLQREDIENEASRIVATQAVKQAARNI
eukprot:TRINITY_DN1463_c0_g1_i1.p1 TRINITY_DN1463_c0_g1~~TRINITY_DN1463_c0_g1_i1.p1  ORF type:complete len:284 (+),score=49.12 TRINITY_DN1463_c0_g1_i1:189-1040(+)